MPWLVDGHNVLGAMHADRRSDDAKRQLVRLLASFARAKRAKVTVVFDGPEPPSFARHLGAVTVVFSGSRSADDVIAARAAEGRGWSVVTSDAGLAARIKRRQVEIVAPAALLEEGEASEAADATGGEEWLAWFADPKNRMGE